MDCEWIPRKAKTIVATMKREMISAMNENNHDRYHAMYPKTFLGISLVSGRKKHFVDVAFLEKVAMAYTCVLPPTQGFNV